MAAGSRGQASTTRIYVLESVLHRICFCVAVLFSMHAGLREKQPPRQLGDRLVQRLTYSRGGMP